MGASMLDGKYGFPFGPRIGARYAAVGGLVPQGISAEMIAEKWDISRAEMDAFGLQSQQRAARATAEGRFESQILPGARRRGPADDAPTRASARPRSRSWPR